MADVIEYICHIWIKTSLRLVSSLNVVFQNFEQTHFCLTVLIQSHAALLQIHAFTLMCRSREMCKHCLNMRLRNELTRTFSHTPSIDKMLMAASISTLVWRIHAQKHARGLKWTLAPSNCTAAEPSVLPRGRRPKQPHAYGTATHTLSTCLQECV